ncbi:molybdenum cofactor guanylyltransferase [Sphingomonas sp. IC-56]|uniref:molybdenum cofactor guanylyltransferase n=1 Tax=Sphingomonas sp. IC-56 TaxID=2898529 RepID=UPI001E38315F|nr:molybdenum cofactor guanylyltransferase [Sphingomonas sp. IC-56]MCD2325368.1 molybdenum cofactor guanylyltransferase [Sphingomonas sp. IC-56]
MRTLGVVLAGGKSSRFGSDKALAMLGGRRLMDHALDNLRRHTDEVAVAGRTLDGVISIPDQPTAGLGPLGGLCGALDYAAAQGFDRVLTCSVDCPDLPAEILKHAPSYLKGQPVIGLWPASAASALREFITTDDRRSVRGFGAHIGALAVDTDYTALNINTPDDLRAAATRLERETGSA